MTNVTFLFCLQTTIVQHVSDKPVAGALQWSDFMGTMKYMYLWEPVAIKLVQLIRYVYVRKMEDKVNTNY